MPAKVAVRDLCKETQNKMEGFANMMEENLEKEKNIKNQINDHEQSLHQS